MCDWKDWIFSPFDYFDYFTIVKTRQVFGHVNVHIALSLMIRASFWSYHHLNCYIYIWYLYMIFEIFFLEGLRILGSWIWYRFNHWISMVSTIAFWDCFILWLLFSMGILMSLMMNFLLKLSSYLIWFIYLIGVWHRCN